jgi:hypothetical protein
LASTAGSLAAQYRANAALAALIALQLEAQLGGTTEDRIFVTAADVRLLDAQNVALVYEILEDNRIVINNDFVVSLLVEPDNRVFSDAVSDVDALVFADERISTGSVVNLTGVVSIDDRVFSSDPVDLSSVSSDNRLLFLGEQ